MRCHRCGEMMIDEEFCGHYGHFFEWKCIFSRGEIVEQVLLNNRRSPAALSPRTLKGTSPTRERMECLQCV
jgi:hypothetical protein